MVKPKKKLLSSVSKRQQNKYNVKNINDKNIIESSSSSSSTHYNPSKLLYHMRLSSNNDDKIDQRNKKILVREARRRQSQVLDASLNDTFDNNLGNINDSGHNIHVYKHDNSPNKDHKHHHRKHHNQHKHHHHHHQNMSQQNVNATSTTNDNMNIDALKTMVFQQAARIAELETENRFLKNVILEQQHQQQHLSPIKHNDEGTVNNINNNITNHPRKHNKQHEALSYEQ